MAVSFRDRLLNILRGWMSRISRDRRHMPDSNNNKIGLPSSECSIDFPAIALFIQYINSISFVSVRIQN
jgi:hypothetical protein